MIRLFARYHLGPEMTSHNIAIRAAGIEDIPLILQFIYRKSEFDRDIGAFSGTVSVTEDKLRQTLFSDHPFAYVLFAEHVDITLGFALYAFRYSSFAGQPSLWLDDLFVDTVHRNKGAGALLMNKLGQVAAQSGCSHLGWTADARNLAGLRFYQRLGAEVTGQQDNRCFLKWVPMN